MVAPLRRFCLFLLLGACPVLAQEAENGQGKIARGRQAWIVSVAIPNEIDNPAKFMAGKDLTEVTLSKRSVGDPVNIPKDGLIRMVRVIPDPEDPTKQIYESLAEASIPESVNKALVILVPIKKTAGSSLLFATKVQDLAVFRGGDTMYLNLSPRKIMVQLGSEKIPLRKGETRITQAPKSDKPENKAVSYSYHDPVKDKWKLLGASTVVVRPTRREICIFSWDSRFDRLDYHGITFPVAKK
jgi:hypothetical protein